MYTHKRTGQKLELINKGNYVSTYNVLDSELNTIIRTNKKGRKLRSVNGEYSLKVAVCHNENVTKIK